jgi:acid phosphatase
MLQSLAILAAAGALVAASPASYASAPAEATIEPTLTQIQQSAATAKAISPVSNVKGLAFNRFIQIWLENTDYSAAAGNPDQQFLAKQGITLTNYFAATHPSEPNYCAAAGGDTFGMDNDDFHSIPADVATVVDLLETKGITWAEYQEDIPFPGFQGYNYSNQETFANDYVRKHDPLILYKSITNNATRRELIKDFDAFHKDVAAKTLPQWAFMTPNMTNDAHDTNVTFASSWLRSFLTPLMSNEYFMNNTLILLTFDENESYGIQNKMFSILMGGAIPANLKGTKDNTFYNHYSTIASVSQNWGLPSLGRWDCHANVFESVANKTG